MLKPAVSSSCFFQVYIGLFGLSSLCHICACLLILSSCLFLCGFIVADILSLHRNQVTGHLIWQQYQEMSSHNHRWRRKLLRVRRLQRMQVKRLQLMVDLQIHLRLMREFWIQYHSLQALGSFSRYWDHTRFSSWVFMAALKWCSGPCGCK